MLDLSKGFVFGVLYNPVIGYVAPTQFPFVLKKMLVKTLPKC